MIFYGILVLFIFPIGVPASYTTLMLRQHDKMTYQAYIEEKKEMTEEEAYVMRSNDPDTRAFGFLFSQYNNKCYWFEAVECLRKMLLCGIVVFIAPNSPTQ